MLFEQPRGTKLRHEWKHIISGSDKAQLIARLRTFCAPDPHYGDSSYHIRSLYFDNVYDKALRERLNGQQCREKFRIRYYNFDDSSWQSGEFFPISQPMSPRRRDSTSARVTRVLCLPQS